jgi:hypothetical protein
MKKLFMILALFFLLCLTFSCQQQVDNVEKIMEDGVEVVINHLEPYEVKGEPNSLHVEKEFVIDMEGDEIAKLGIGDVESLEVDSEECIYFRASRASESIIFKFDSYGKYVTSFGKRGQGPGEISNPTFFCINKNDEIVVTDYAKRKIVLFSKEGGLLNENPLPLRLRAVYPLENGNCIGLKQSIDQEGFEPSLQSFLCLYNSEFTEIKELDRQRPFNYMTSDKMDSIPQIFHWEVHDGRIYTGNGKRGYEILVYDMDGNLVMKVRKKCRPVELLEEYKKHFLTQFSTDNSWQKKIFFSSEMPPYSEFFIDDVGRVFVILYEKDKDSGEHMCDVFNQEGIFFMKKNLKIILRGMDLVLSGQGWGVFNYIVAKKSRLYHLRTKESGYKELVVYRMIWE